MNMILDESKSETVSSIGIKLSTINLNKYHLFYDKPSADIIKWSLLRSPETFPCITIHQTSILHYP